MKMNRLKKDDAAHVRLEHEHIKSLGLDATLPHGTNVHYEGHGEVVDSGTSEGPDGEARHHMTIRLHRHGLEHDAEDGKEASDGLRGQIRQITDKTEAKAADRALGRKSDPVKATGFG